MRSLAVLLLLAVSGAIGCNQSEANTQTAPSNPVTNGLQISHRYSILNSSTAVLQLQNITSGPLSGVTIHYYNQDSGETMGYTVGTINPGRQKEIGVLESGWSIEPNEIVTISAYGYDAVKYYFWLDNRGQLVASQGYGLKKLHQVQQGTYDFLK